MWRGTGVAPLSGTWGSVIGEARGINNRGDVVGVIYGGIGGYVWSDGIFKPLASKATVALEGNTPKLIFSIEDSSWRHRNDSAWL